MPVERPKSQWQDAKPFILRHFAAPGLAGSLAGACCALAMIRGNLFGLATLMGQSSSGPVAAALLCFGFAVTFGSAAIGASLMADGWD